MVLPGGTRDPPNREGIRREQLVSKPGSIQDMVRYSIEEQLQDEDVDDGRFAAGPLLVRSLCASEALDPATGPSNLTGGMRQYA